jgi:hypothetical protein
MKKYAKISKNFITKLNNLIRSSNKKMSDRFFYTELLNNINEIKEYYRYDESLIMSYIKEKEPHLDESTLIFLVYNKSILSIFSKNTRNIQNINHHSRYNNMDCNHKMVPFKISKYEDIRYIDTEEDFSSMMGTLDRFIIDVYDHSYRTYIPFVCYIVLINSDGFIYIINSLSLRKNIIESGLFKCKYQKVFINLSYKKLKVDYQDISCYRILDINIEDVPFRRYLISSDTQIDWRIPNIQLYLKKYIQERSINLINNCKINKNKDNICREDDDFLYLDKDSDSYFTIFKNYLTSKYSLEDDEYLLSLLRNRENIAKINNESIYYVMTNTQLILFHKNKFRDDRDIINRKIPLSSILKQNINLFYYKQIN